MRRWTGMRDETSRLERELRASRPEPRAEFLEGLAGELADVRPVRQRSRARVAFALAFTTFVVGSFASFGGIGYAASSAASAADVVKDAVAAHPPQARVSSAAQEVHNPPTAPASQTAGQAQGAGAQAGVQTSLPFTGVSLFVTAILGLALVGTGLILRRSEKAAEKK